MINFISNLWKTMCSGSSTIPNWYQYTIMLVAAMLATVIIYGIVWVIISLMTFILSFAIVPIVIFGAFGYIMVDLFRNQSKYGLDKQ